MFGAFWTNGARARFGSGVCVGACVGVGAGTGRPVGKRGQGAPPSHPPPQPAALGRPKRLHARPPLPPRTAPPAGQICSSTSRILVHESVAPAFYERLKERARSIRVGDPLQPGCRLGPVVSEGQYKRVMSYVQVGRYGRGSGGGTGGRGIGGGTAGLWAGAVGAGWCVRRWRAAACGGCAPTDHWPHRRRRGPRLGTCCTQYCLARRRTHCNEWPSVLPTAPGPPRPAWTTAPRC
jgi:hypothetical protein